MFKHYIIFRTGPTKGDPLHAEPKSKEAIEASLQEDALSIDQVHNKHWPSTKNKVSIDPKKKSTE